MLRFPYHYTTQHTLDLQGLSTKQLLRRLCNEILQQEGHFVIFSLPNEPSYGIYLCQKEDALHLDASQLAEVGKAFVVGEFAYPNVPLWVLCPSVMLSLKEKTLSYCHRQAGKKDWKAWLLDLTKKGTHPALSIPRPYYEYDKSHAKDLNKPQKTSQRPERVKKGEEREEGEAMAKASYVDLADKALAALAQQDLEKVVISRRTSLSLAKGSDLIDIFYRLAKGYPSCFTYFCCSSVAGVWMGASPELLASCNQETFKSMALAGTKKIATSARPKDIQWQDKEIREQGIVRDYIKEALSVAGIASIDMSSQKVVRVVDLLHLCTYFRGRVPREKSSIAKVLEHLHPTPALCGRPRTAALRFIKEYEKTPRAAYGGFLGPLYSSWDYAFYVNIRCARFFLDKAWLYVGGGIVAGSDPNSEWNETVWKAQAFRRALVNE